MQYDLPVHHFRNRVSDKSFGLTIAAAAWIFAAYTTYLGQQDYAIPAWITGLVFLVAAFLFPILLRPLNTLWFYLGIGLQFVFSPLLLLLLFLIFFIPVGLFRRILKRRQLTYKADSQMSGYWITRKERLHSDSFKHMF